MRYRILIAILIAGAGGAAGHVFAQATPSKTAPDFAHEQYVTHRELADKEVAALKETQKYILGLIAALVVCGVGFGGNSMAIRSFRQDLRRHSGVHAGLRKSQVGLSKEFKDVLGGIDRRLQHLEGLSDGAETRVAIDELKTATDEMKAATGVAIDELKALLKDGASGRVE